MTSPILTRTKRPRTILAGTYGHPVHPMLVTLPIGAWVASLFFDLIALFTDEPAVFAKGAYWLIGIGIVGALVAATFGFLDLLAIPGGTPAFRTALLHMGLNLTVVGLFIIGFAVRAAYEELSTPGLILSLVALTLLGFSGWLSGRLAYHYGVRVADEATQAEGFH